MNNVVPAESIALVFSSWLAVALWCLMLWTNRQKIASQRRRMASSLRTALSEGVLGCEPSVPQVTAAPHQHSRA
jgi:hypothetical protein